MSIYRKDALGNISPVASHFTQRFNMRWFLCQRSIEEGVEYYDVPEEALKYFSSFDPYTMYSFGFMEPNTTNNPKIRFVNQAFYIKEFGLESDELAIGRLNGVFQMFTKSFDSELIMYFTNNMNGIEVYVRTVDGQSGIVDLSNSYADKSNTEIELAKKSGVFINGELVSSISLTSDPQKQLDALMPAVGDYYFTESATVNPAERFGGSWTKLADVFLVAAGGKYAVGSTGGEESHTLTVQEMPAHTHNIGAAGALGVQDFVVLGDDNRIGTAINAAESTGGGQPHNNLPPYRAVYMWRREA